MNKTSIFFSVFACVAGAQTQAAPVAVPAECKINPQVADSVIPSDQVSGDYWTNMMGPDIVLFTNTGGVSGRFQGFDLKKKVPIRLTDDIDPFPAPDGRRMYVHPQPIQFFNFDETRKRIEENGESQSTLYETPTTHPDGFVKNTDPKRAATYTDYDPKFQGYYESLAALKTSHSPSANYSTYRVLTGEGEGAIKDYKVIFGAHDKIVKIETQSKAVSLCPEMRNAAQVDLDFDTPIISPKGNEFAVQDRKTKSTVILSFNPITGRCKREVDLGFNTGKLHFSKDGSQIAFSSASLDHSLVQKPFLYDRNTKKLTSLSVGDPTEEAQGTFPTFMENGKIVYQRVVMDDDGNATKDWVIVDPKKFNSALMKNQTANCPTCNANLAVDPNLDRLQALWVLKCTDHIVKTGVFQWSMTITPDDCKRFVESAAADQSRHDRELLLQACPARKTSTVGASFTKHSLAQTFPRLLQSECVICHVPGSPHGYIPFDDPEKMRSMNALGHSALPGETFVQQVERILKANMDRDHMDHSIPTVPADGAALNPTQISTVLDWMKTGSKGHYQATAPSANDAVQHHEDN
jgi:hypothetical protein